MLVHWTNAGDSQNVLWLRRKLLFRQKQASVPSKQQSCATVSHKAVFQNIMNVSRSLKCVNVLKVLRRLFQNWHLTQKWPKVKLSAHKWGGAFLSLARRHFLGTPRLVWTPASQAPCGCARLTSSTKRPAASGRQAGNNLSYHVKSLKIEKKQFFSMSY